MFPCGYQGRTGRRRSDNRSAFFCRPGRKVVTQDAIRQIRRRCPGEHRVWRKPAMNFYVGLLAAAAVTALVGASQAAECDKFVVRGDAAKVLMEENQINVATAEGVAKAYV